MGKFVQGVSGNPAGRPRKPERAIQSLIPAAMAALDGIMKDPASQPETRLKAAEIVLNTARGCNQ